MFRSLKKELRRGISSLVMNPLSDLKSSSIRLRTFRALRRSQWLPREQLQVRQQARLQEIVAHAGRYSQYYRNLFAASGFDSGNFTLDEFHRLPLLEKRVVSRDLDQLLVDGSVKEKLVNASTGGSTGTALALYFDRKWQERRVADEMRADEWSGWRLGMQKAAVWGNPPVAENWYQRFKDRWLYCLDLYLDTMNITPVTMDTFVAQWQARDEDILFGHAHSIFVLADYLSHRPGHGMKPRGIIATSMMLLENERKIIEQVFGCPVTNRYGCEEVALIACECERHRGMHLNIEHLYIEFLDEHGQQAQPGAMAEIVVTDLYNKAMPLIRYRVGDMGTYSGRSCDCGRGLPILEHVIGRTADFLKRADGSRVAGVSLVERTLTAIPGIAQLQLVQTALDCIEANLVAAAGYTESSGARLVDELRAVFGQDLQVRLNFMDGIPREASGKYRFAKCQV
jgi:phenylacetate-coenzyme A ligase PaaK-like adenylate-forming protein